MLGFFEKPSWDESQLDCSEADELLAEFTDTVVSFTEQPATGIDSSLSSDEPPIVRLVELMVDEAIQEGATEIELRLVEGTVTVIYHFSDGRSRNRDAPPARLLHPLLKRLRSVFGEGEPFHHKSGATIMCKFDSDNLGGVLHVAAM